MIAPSTMSEAAIEERVGLSGSLLAVPIVSLPVAPLSVLFRTAGPSDEVVRLGLRATGRFSVRIASRRDGRS